MDGKIKLIPYDKHTNDEYRDVVKDSLFLGFFYKGEATEENPFGTICGVNECDKVDVLSELKNIVCFNDEDNDVNIVFSTNNRLVLVCEDRGSNARMMCNELIVGYMNDYINVNLNEFDESAWVKMVNRIHFILQTPFFIAFTEDIVSIVFDYITDTFVKLSIKGNTTDDIKLEDIINSHLELPDKFSFIPEGNIIITNEDYFKNFSKYMCVIKQEEIGTELYYFDKLKKNNHFLNLYATIYNFVVNSVGDVLLYKDYIKKSLPNMELLFGIVIIKSLNK